MVRKKHLSVKQKTTRLIFAASTALLLLTALLLVVVQGNFISSLNCE